MSDNSLLVSKQNSLLDKWTLLKKIKLLLECLIVLQEWYKNDQFSEDVVKTVSDRTYPNFIQIVNTDIN